MRPEEWEVLTSSFSQAGFRVFMCILQIPEVFCDSSKANTGEEVDGKPSHRTIEAKSEGKLM